MSSIPKFYHSFPDWEIKGELSNEAMTNKLQRLSLPESMEGEKVLDIGAWDGFYSFECAKRGASVTAIEPDWSIRPGFAYLNKKYKMKCEQKEISVYDIESLGIQFDRVLCLGVLYHLRHPLLAIEKIFSTLKNGGEAVFEFASINWEIQTDVAKFVPGPPSKNNNWWRFNLQCIADMVTSCGFEIDNKFCNNPLLKEDRGWVFGKKL